MEPKVELKNKLLEKLQDKSKDELIDIIADMSRVYVMIRAAGAIALALDESKRTETNLDSHSIIDDVASIISRGGKNPNQSSSVNYSLLNKNQLDIEN